MKPKTRSTGAGKAAKLSFKATRVTAEVGIATTLLFEVEREGDAEVYFGLTSDPGGMLVSWSDGKTIVEDCVIAIANQALDKKVFRLDYKETDPAKVGPYKGVELTLELDEESEPDVTAAFAKLFAAKKEVLPPPVSASVRKRGSPQLGVLAATRDEWRAQVGKDAEFEVSVSNGGGPAQGISLEIGGPALAHLEVREAKAQGKSAKVETKGNAARVVLEHVKVEADLDIDRKALGKEAPPLPKFPFTLVVRGKTAGQALLTVRVTPRTADGRGAAMVGRTIVVEP